jgi:glycosyltransferase involved in cell wall biosynthesis
MKIGFMSKFLPEKDGIAIYSENLLKELRKLGLDIVKIGTKGSKADYKLDFSSLNLRSELDKIIKKENLDLLHIQYIATWYGKYSFNLPIIKCLKLPVPKILTLHEVQYDRKTRTILEKVRLKLLQLIEKQLVRNSDKLIVHTLSQRSFVNKKYKTRKAECTFMGVSLNNMQFKKSKNVLFFGMMNYGKGIEYLIRAMKSLSDFNMKAYGRLVNKDYGRKLAKDSKDMKNVDLKMGWVSDKKKDELYRWANIVVLPYVWAPYQSAVLHDAISYGLPVVVTKTGAVWEIVDKFKLGSVVKPKDSKSIAKGIKDVFIGYSKYKKGLIRYREEANWVKVAKKHFEIYRGAVK